MQLSQIRPGYVRALKNYLSVLESRNALLRQDKLQGVSDFANQLDAWDEQLANAARAHCAQPPLVSAGAEREFQPGIRGHFRKSGRALFPFLRRPAGSVRNALRGDAERPSAQPGGRPAADVHYLRPPPGRCEPAAVRQRSASHGQSGPAAHRRSEHEAGGDPPDRKRDGRIARAAAGRCVQRAGRQAPQRPVQKRRALQTFITCTDRQDAAGAKADCFLQVTSTPEGTVLRRE